MRRTACPDDPRYGAPVCQRLVHAGWRVLGHLNMGWYPAAVAVAPNQDKLYVVNNKGKGAGPNGGAAFGPRREYIGELELGNLAVLPLSPGVTRCERGVLVQPGQAENGQRPAL